MPKSKTKLLVREVIEIVHNQRVLITLIDWDVDDSALTVILNHLLNIVDTNHVDMHALHLLSHHFRESVES